jgi:hypothetical protein
MSDKKDGKIRRRFFIPRPVTSCTPPLCNHGLLQLAVQMSAEYPHLGSQRHPRKSLFFRNILVKYVTVPCEKLTTKSQFFFG